MSTFVKDNLLSLFVSTRGAWVTIAVWYTWKLYWQASWGNMAVSWQMGTSAWVLGSYVTLGFYGYL